MALTSILCRIKIRANKNIKTMFPRLYYTISSLLCQVFLTKFLNYILYSNQLQNIYNLTDHILLTKGILMLNIQWKSIPVMFTYINIKTKTTNLNSVMDHAYFY